MQFLTEEPGEPYSIIHLSAHSYKGKQIQIIENKKVVFTGTIKECAKFMSLTALSNIYTSLNDNRLINRKYKLIQI